MKISYKGLRIRMAEKNIRAADIVKNANVSQATMTRINRGESTSLSILYEICKYLDCNIGDIVKFIYDE
ncbi:helix-turn-helix transcriptional regulator [Clostridium sp. D2Q-11]|uniref:Helix-turn-helix transcriptional regulator n=1 Tax=Anaeromonas frigoriresistens TaxID=2683708 RepID=A0A942V267_9FIRM|nr:helix-turn-helix transcriptional regulator [Anaeromonas frigoriresistens]MBS4539787.1 helix-turn-helix transcriptional regulator [Anaeromonas frigoriresistens]